MARYWNQKNLIVDGIVPGSMVGIWTTLDGDIDRQICIERSHHSKMEVSIPRDENLLVRVRNVNYRSFETTVDTWGTDATTSIRLSVIAVRDD